MNLRNSRLTRLYAPVVLAALLFCAGVPLRAGNDDPLLMACANEDVGKAKSLLAAGANPDAVGDKGLTCLMIAAFKGNNALARAALQGGANREMKFDGKTTAAELADLKNHTETASLIRDWSGGGSRPGGNGGEASGSDLLAACAGEDVPKVQSLLAAGANVNATADKGMTCLMIAAFKGNDNMARALLAAGADRELKFDGKSTAAEIADAKSNAATASLIRSGGNGSTGRRPTFGGDANDDAPGGTAGSGADLLAACASEDVPKVQSLLAAGANVNATASKGMTCLMVAAFKGNDNLARALLAAGADRDLKFDGKTTAAEIADSKSNSATANLIRSGGRAPATAETGAGGTADTDFLNAVAEQDVEKVKALLHRGANPNAQSSGKSALLMAALVDNAPLVQALINGGADVNFRDDSLTPLIVAAFKGNASSAKSLILAGADCNFKTPQGKTAEQIATEKGQAATARAIRQACR